MKTNGLLFLLLFLIPVSPIFAQDTPYAILSGKVERKDYHTYVEKPFVLPAGVTRLRVEFSYTGKEQRTTIDIGLWDPVRFRGWSGGARSGFTISAEDATPGYLPGVLPAGEWKLLLGIPNIRVGVVSTYEARVYISTSVEVTEFSPTPIRAQAGWYRGDLHMHSGNSDGKCASQLGHEVGCPVYRIAAAAVEKGLDFIAVTDHNTISQADALRELQPAFDQLLLVPGREITTFYGHANVFGLTDFIDFRMTDSSYAAAAGWMNAVNRFGGIISINHPGLPSGEDCMGCGWRIGPIPAGVITAVEVLNGATMKRSVEGPLQGWDLWNKLLSAGQHVTAIGGSDDHRSAAIGTPTTVIYMKELSVHGLIDGIRSGRVFIDLAGDTAHFLDLVAVGAAASSAASAGAAAAAAFTTSAPAEAHMGGTLPISPADTVRLTAFVRGVAGGKVEFIVDGRVATALGRRLSSGDERVEVRWVADDKRHSIYAKVRDKDDKLVLVGNPVYIEN